MRTFIPLSIATLAMSAVSVTTTTATATTGTVPVGSTISATAWEREIDGFDYEDGYIVASPDGIIDEYVYRLFDGDSSVDVQGTGGYEGLTEAEQSQWYVDEGLDPYEFSWTAFYCLADEAPEGTVTDAGIELDEMIYISAEDLFPTEPRSWNDDYIADLWIPWADMSLFGEGNTNSLAVSTVGYFSDSTGDVIFSTSYADFSCPEGSTLQSGIILDPDNTDNPATDRELTIPEVLAVGLDSGVTPVNAEGVFIGVTGTVSVNLNAALWGMTQVDGELANTGASDNLGVAALIGVGAVAAGVAVIRRRRA